MKIKKPNLKESVRKLQQAKQRKQKIQKHKERLQQPPKKSTFQIHVHSENKKKYEIPFTEKSTVLVVGDGNFSFSRALFDRIQIPIVATCYDSEDEVLRKYVSSRDNIDYLVENGCSVLFEIDARKMHTGRALKNKRFSRIIFNFPHVGSGIKDQDRNIIANQTLLKEFFLSAASLLATDGPFYSLRTYNTSKPYNDDLTSTDYIADQGFHQLNEEPEIHVTIWQGSPYDLWDIKKLIPNSLTCKESFEFQPEKYDGYIHRRTIGDTADNEFEEKKSRTFVFKRKE